MAKGIFDNRYNPKHKLALLLGGLFFIVLAVRIYLNSEGNSIGDEFGLVLVLFFVLYTACIYFFEDYANQAAFIMVILFILYCIASYIVKYADIIIVIIKAIMILFCIFVIFILVRMFLSHEFKYVFTTLKRKIIFLIVLGTAVTFTLVIYLNRDAIINKKNEIVLKMENNKKEKEKQRIKQNREKEKERLNNDDNKKFVDSINNVRKMIKKDDDYLAIYKEFSRAKGYKSFDEWSKSEKELYANWYIKRIVEDYNNMDDPYRSIIEDVEEVVKSGVDYSWSDEQREIIYESVLNEVYYNPQNLIDVLNSLGNYKDSYLLKKKYEPLAEKKQTILDLMKKNHINEYTKINKVNEADKKIIYDLICEIQDAYNNVSVAPFDMMLVSLKGYGDIPSDTRIESNEISKSDKSNIDIVNQIQRTKCISEYGENIDIDSIETVKFGTYPQNDLLRYSHEDIEWFVLEKDTTNKRALLISKKILDVNYYNSNDSSTNWETSTIRSWLNGSFYNKAFSDVNKNYILTTTLNNEENISENDVNQYTEDKIFVLSKNELIKYYGNVDENNEIKKLSYGNYYKCITKFAEYSENNNDNDVIGSYLTRTKGKYYTNEITTIGSSGEILFGLVNEREGVRPALYVIYE